MPQAIPQQPGMVPQNMIPNQAMTPQMRYVHDAQKIINSVQERNPYLKDQVGHLIFDYVQMLAGPEKAPKITGMLIELQVPQIKQYLSSFEALQMRVEEASRLLAGEAGQE
jgi:hypothetical protein